MTEFALSTMKSEQRQLPSLFSDISVHAQCDTAVTNHRYVFYSRWSTNKDLICIMGICSTSWMAGHSKQYIYAWMENNCSCTELITVTVCAFSCVSLLCPGLWSALQCCYQMTCIYCSPLIALPAWHLASFPLPGSQDPGEVLTVTHICLSPLQLAWEVNDSSPPCRWGFVWWGGGLRGECCFSLFSKVRQIQPHTSDVRFYRLSQGPYIYCHFEVVHRVTVVMVCVVNIGGSLCASA